MISYQEDSDLDTNSPWKSKQTRSRSMQPVVSTSVNHCIAFIRDRNSQRQGPHSTKSTFHHSSESHTLGRHTTHNLENSTHLIWHSNRCLKPFRKCKWMVKSIRQSLGIVQQPKSLPIGRPVVTYRGGFWSTVIHWGSTRLDERSGSKQYLLKWHAWAKWNSG